MMTKRHARILASVFLIFTAVLSPPVTAQSTRDKLEAISSLEGGVAKCSVIMEDFLINEFFFLP